MNIKARRAAGNEVENTSRGNRPRHLRDDVMRQFGSREAPAGDQANADRGIQVTS